MRPFIAVLLIALSTSIIWTATAAAADAEPSKAKGPKAIYQVAIMFQPVRADADVDGLFGFVEDCYPVSQWRHDYELSSAEKRRIIFYTYEPAEPVNLLHETSPETGTLLTTFIVRAIGDAEWKKIRDRLDIDDDWYAEPEPADATEATEKPNFSEPVAESNRMPTLYYKLLISLNAFEQDADLTALTTAIDKEKGPHSWYRLEVEKAKLSFVLYTAKPDVALRFVNQTARANGHFIVGAAAEPVKVSDWASAAEKMGVTEKPAYSMIEKQTD